jgi:GNAT superfamily N-acetyltransferase
MGTTPFMVVRARQPCRSRLREPVHALVAERAGELLGLTHYLFHRNTIQIEPSCYLQDLFTLPAARGHGVGRALIEAVYEQAQSVGVT